MSYFETIVLAVIQGLTEFVPVSSSGHLVLMRVLGHWSDEGGVFLDVVLHAGSLVAILVYFRVYLWQMFKGFFMPSAPAELRKESRGLVLKLILATIPAVVAGVFLESRMSSFRSGLAVGIIMMATAAWFTVCERIRRMNAKGEVTVLGAVFMGLAQIVAMLPGASRSGWTIAAGVLNGANREKAARFSFLMAIPVLLGAVALELVKGCPSGMSILIILTGFAVCFAVSLVAIMFCMQLFKRHSLIPFAVYLVLLGAFFVIRSVVI
jgi:undecaprenyl-diphosphatase